MSLDTCIKCGITSDSDSDLHVHSTDEEVLEELEYVKELWCGCPYVKPYVLVEESIFANYRDNANKHVESLEVIGDVLVLMSRCDEKMLFKVTNEYKNVTE